MDASRSNAFDMNSFSGFVDVSFLVVGALMLAEDTAAANAVPPASLVAVAVAMAVTTADVDDKALKEASEAEKGSVFSDDDLSDEANNRFDVLSAVADNPSEFGRW